MPLILEIPRRCALTFTIEKNANVLPTAKVWGEFDLMTGQILINFSHEKLKFNQPHISITPSRNSTHGLHPVHPATFAFH